MIRYIVMGMLSIEVDRYLMSVCANAHVVMFSAYMCTCMARTNSDPNHHKHGNDY
ncbi:MAG TPA: hypothetical protein VGG71_01635 [Chitinophagaceae bacterium]